MSRPTWIPVQVRAHDVEGGDIVNYGTGWFEVKFASRDRLTGKVTIYLVDGRNTRGNDGRSFEPYDLITVQAESGPS